MQYRFGITAIDQDPAVSFPYLNVAARGKVRRQPWPIHMGQAAGLPDGLDGLFIVSDLQGQADPMLPDSAGCRLVGEYLPVYYASAAQANGWPDPSRVGVILAGDLFALSDRRGGLGDTLPVWRAMSKTFQWSVGVLGNHDLVGEKDARHVSGEVCSDAWVLNGDSFEFGNLKIGGVGGIIGREDKPCRFSPDHYYSMLIDAVGDGVDLLVLHEAPSIAGLPGRGSELITEALTALEFQGTVICGHSCWADWYHQWEDSFSVINVEGRAVLLSRHYD